MEEVNNKETTLEEAYIEVETRENNAIKSLLLTQRKANPIKQEEIIKTIAEYKEVIFAFDILTDQDINRNKRRIKEYSIEKIVLCLLCH